MDVVSGACQIQDGCDKSCFRFRQDNENELLCGHCKHDISNHKIIGIFHDGKFFAVGENATMAAAPLPLVLHESADEERKRLFKTKPRSSVGGKRKITADPEEPRRWSGARNADPAVPAVVSRPLHIAAKLIAMRRDADVPQTNFDVAEELGLDCFANIEFTTAKSLTSLL